MNARDAVIRRDSAADVGEQEDEEKKEKKQSATKNSITTNYSDKVSVGFSEPGKSTKRQKVPHTQRIHTTYRISINVPH